MAFAFSCECGKKLRVEDEDARRPTIWPSCRREVVIQPPLAEVSKVPPLHPSLPATQSEPGETEREKSSGVVRLSRKNRGGRVTRALDRLIEQRGRPENVRTDNGPEFTSRRMLGWAEECKVSLIHIQPGRPMQNGHVESFHGRLRDECLNANWFRTLKDLRRTLDSWRQEYNCERPHSSLAYRTPAEFSRALGYGDVESKQRFPHPHSPDYDDGEIYSPTNLKRETPATNG